MRFSDSSIRLAASCAAGVLGVGGVAACGTLDASTVHSGAARAPAAETATESPTGTPELSGPSVEAPTTLQEAQQVYDPHNDPLILVEKQEDGTYASVMIAVLDDAYIPPASVQTAQQYAQWSAQVRSAKK